MENEKEIEEIIGNEELIEGVPNKSIEDIIREVAQEEGMTEDEVRETLQELGNLHASIKKSKNHTKAKRNKAKEKAKKKQAKKSKKRNR
ncbi:hypothetical protein JDW21_19385 [Bacillus subtilis]|uniref:Uncharacterized protein n=2 Tax=Zhangjivirus TaxID=3044867 RepID=A0AAE9K747_9CAUD|nr:MULTISPECIES: hypothetical protein [Bacillus subtilis group]YP_010681717.1 HU-like DNA-binding protein [Bacillus phage vB_BsuS_PJN02]YP_010740225.1 hypothetical protein P9294_gp208 [Bacillus phage FADO]MCR4362025.1 hypothetical protein [Bacillus subtilis]UNH58442.1 HU-like DNA-binding protein [Bacillus phage vB_BsuS_PJN02]UNY48923.1 hypothetical protein fado_208 [Bacillus phage FADO]UQB84358.1 hypothetical protein KMZ31_19760 [Bacillus amyloliquefaciens]WOF32996.1 hypothetical protein OEJ